MFLEILKHVLNTHAPIKTIRIKHCRKIWMTAEYNKMTNIARKAKRNFSKNRTKDAFVDYRKLRNKHNLTQCYQKICERSKRLEENLGHFEHTCWPTENGNCDS